ncbi:MAG: hypothetical protein M3Q45_00435 [Chloroflexota bacterium]|nr:hypothetical protein [Chloroflexota bacterium]
MADYRLGAWSWSIGFVVGGVLLLLFTFGRLAAYEPWLQVAVAGVLTLSGLIFIGAFLSARQNWWRLIPGWTLLTLAGMVYLSTWPNVGGELRAALLFLGLACGFTHVYLLDRTERWWALIPGGFMLVLGGVISLSRQITNIALLGALLFVGMGLVFFLLTLLGDKRRHWWALIPGAVLALFGLSIFADGNGDPSGLLRWWPLLLIAIGVGFAVQALRRGGRTALSINQAPRPRPPVALPNKSQPAATKTSSSALLDYTRPAPGATVDILPDPDE